MFKALLISVLTVTTVIGCGADKYQQKEKAEEEMTQGNRQWEASANQFRYAFGIENMIRTGAVPTSKESLTEVRTAYAKSRDTLVLAKKSYESVYNRAKASNIPVKNHGQLIDRINEVTHTIGQIDAKIVVIEQEIKDAKPKAQIKIKAPGELDT